MSKFKIGDKVRLVGLKERTLCRQKGYNNGDIVTITQFRGSYSARLSKEGCEDTFLPFHRLEPVDTRTYMTPGELRKEVVEGLQGAELGDGPKEDPKKVDIMGTIRRMSRGV